MGFVKKAEILSGNSSLGLSWADWHCRHDVSSIRKISRFERRMAISPSNIARISGVG